MAEELESEAWPTDISIDRAARTLTVAFDTGERYVLDAEYMRVESPSAEVQGHGPGQRTTVGGKINVGIEAVEPVGNYAVRVLFDDGHDTGIFSWKYLRKLGRERDTFWPAYLAALAEKGLDRDPSRNPLDLKSFTGGGCA